MGLDHELYALPKGTSLEDSWEASKERFKVRVEIIVWRKNYAIDPWFFDNGITTTDLGSSMYYPVSFEHLMLLKDCCSQVLFALECIGNALPRFLSLAMDDEDFEWLKADLVRTKDVLSKLEDNPNLIYAYHK